MLSRRSIMWSDLALFLPPLMKGVVITIELTILAVITGSLVGLILALLRMSPIRAIWFPIFIIINILRSVPIIVQLMYCYFVLPLLGIQLSAFNAGLLGLTTALCGYHAENFRAAIMSVDRGQYEASISIGMKKWQVMRRIILPQAIRIALPPFGNLTVLTLKDTSIASVITVAELTHIGNNLASATYKTIEIFSIVAIIYIVLSIPLTLLNVHLEKRYNISRH